MTKEQGVEKSGGHPYDFQVSGPRHISSSNWRDTISSSWKDNNYRRTVIACFIQAAYLLELDRQENKTEENSLAPKWCKPFKYKIAQPLVDERDGSVFGAIIEWDRYAALSDFIPMRPSGAPRAVLTLRGTLLKTPTFRRDLQDDLRFLAWESLKGSIRFNVALEALKAAVKRFGSSDVCIAGHSLGAGFALQIGKALAREGVFVETHLFNPPSVSLAMIFRSISEKASFAWKKFRSMLPPYVSNNSNSKENIAGGSNVCGEVKRWIPHLYVNNSDYVCCYYMDSAGTTVSAIGSSSPSEPVKTDVQGQVSAKLFVMFKGPKRFLEAHGLEQWWSNDMELQEVIHNSKLISNQLKSLYTLPASSQGQPK